MQQGNLGRTGIRASRLALGTGRLGAKADGGSDQVVAGRMLAAFAEAGGTFIDTSSAYQLGRAEEMVGDFLAAAGRDRFVVASKYGRSASAVPPAAMVGCHRGAMRMEVEGSLRRLRTDRIDLYFPHFDDGATPVEEIMRGLDDLVRAGKIVHAGLSNFPAWRIASAAMLAELRGWAPVAVLQLGYNLLDRSAERGHLPLARARGLGVMAYSPLAGGALTARLRARTTAEGADGQDTLADALLRVARELGCEPAGVALNWAGMKSIIPVIGPREPEQLAASLAAAGMELTDTQAGSLDEASAPGLGQPYELLAQARRHAGMAGRAGDIL